MVARLTIYRISPLGEALCCHNEYLQWFLASLHLCLVSHVRGAVAHGKDSGGSESSAADWCQRTDPGSQKGGTEGSFEIY